MKRFFKHRIYKKYRDEIWGSLITSRSFSYNKRSVLLNYKRLSLKRRFKIRTKYNYFRPGFLKFLRYTAFKFNMFAKRLHMLNFIWRRRFLKTTSSYSPLLLNVKRQAGWIVRPGRRWKRRFITVRSTIFTKVRPVKCLSRSLLFLISLNLKRKRYAVRRVSSPLTLTSRTPNPTSFLGLALTKTAVFVNFTKFLRINNLRFTIRKKLNLRRHKSFFYSVHIASPRKKTKKWSLFGLKNIYYRKVSLFFGFKNPKQLFKLYRNASKIWGSNETFLLSLLEARVPVLLTRLGYFPSIYFLKRFILSGNILVNNKVVIHPSYTLSPGEIISFNKKYFKFVYFSLKSRLLSGKMFLNSPPFVEADYKLLLAMVVRRPLPSDLTQPVSFDLYTSFVSFNR